MGEAHREHYRWWLLDGELDIVSDGAVAATTLRAALVDLSRSVDRLGESGKFRARRPYSLIVYRGTDVVAWRPSSLGIC